MKARAFLKWGGIVLLLGVVGFGILTSRSPLFAPIERAQEIKMMSNGTMLNIAMQAMGLDRPAPGAPHYPADFPPTATTADYLTYLVRGGYLSEKDLRIVSGRRHPEVRTLAELGPDSSAFVIFRVSADDPPDTVFLLSKSNVFKDAAVIVRKDGERGISPRAEAVDLILRHLPAARPPAFLP